MIEAQWLEPTHPVRLLRFVRGRLSPRKLRLFGVAYCDRHLASIPDDRCRLALRVSERYADGCADDQEINIAFTTATECMEHYVAEQDFDIAVLARAVRDAIGNDFERVCRYVFVHSLSEKDGWHNPVLSETCNLIRDLIGNPFHLVPALSQSVRAWNDGTVVKIAQGIYEERAFDRLPILHDALIDAGCENEDILAHCRGEGPHVRGCWVIDLILSKDR